MMDFVLMILTPLQMLLINLFVIHQCIKFKYNKKLTYILMGFSTIVLLIIAYLISKTIPGFGSGNGLFIFSGFLFIIPLMLLYKSPGVRIITIACFSWTYTFMVFALSVRLSHVIHFAGWSLSAKVFLLQTILYILSFDAFYNMLKSKFIYSLNHIGEKEATALMWMNMMWFWTVFIFNLSFVYPQLEFFQIISFITLSVCLISSFHYIYLQISSGKTIQDLEKLAYHDELTQLRSRVVLRRDAHDLIERKIPFQLIFFDLDDFKNINDWYGHLIGDRYLAFFAHEIKLRIGNRGGFYRVAGDEFVCIFSENGLNTFLEEITALPQIMPNSNVKFLGFSYGVASFPQDGETAESLLQCADRRMYEMKRSTKTFEKRSVL
ncbi:MAG: GGDEF domain-containing protein [Firmicutes bacterium]|nr:GGDEF domain-containing protein [Bacillota bacterium]